MEVLTQRGRIYRKSLRFYCRKFGVECARAEIDGSMIGRLAAAGKWPDIKLHCLDDVRMTRELALRVLRNGPQLLEVA